MQALLAGINLADPGTTTEPRGTTDAARLSTSVWQQRRASSGRLRTTDKKSKNCRVSFTDRWSGQRTADHTRLFLRQRRTRETSRRIATASIGQQQRAAEKSAMPRAVLPYVAVQEGCLHSGVADWNFHHWARASPLDGHAADDRDEDRGTENKGPEDDDSLTPHKQTTQPPTDVRGC